MFFIKLISNVGCVSCMSAKKMLKRKGVEFKEMLFKNLDESERNHYTGLAKSKEVMSFPLIFNSDEELITLDETGNLEDVDVVDAEWSSGVCGIR